MISLIYGLLKRKTSTKLIDTENRLVVARGGGVEGWRLGEMDEIFFVLVLI